MIEVFKTNVQEPIHAASLSLLLLRSLPGSKINFDLEDCDRVLRVEAASSPAQTVMQLMKNEGYECVPLE